MTYYRIGLSLWLLYLAGCGYDPNYYEDEVINFDAKVAQQLPDNHEEDIGNIILADGFADEWGVVRFGYDIPWFYPLFDYYLRPIPYEIPVSPYHSVIDFLPPMYFSYYLDLWEDDDHH